MRRSIDVPIMSLPGDRLENRDAGKVFVVTEVSAGQAEEWGLRALMALGTSGIIVPKELVDAGAIGLALVGYQALMGAREDAVLPLWREMIPACVTMRTADGNGVMPFNEQLIEEVSTRIELRKRILELHTGFTLAELAQKLKQAGSAATASNSPNTSTRRKRSPRSSPSA